jgi:hypothetical protein
MFNGVTKLKSVIITSNKNCEITSMKGVFLNCDHLVSFSMN